MTIDPPANSLPPTPINTISEEYCEGWVQCLISFMPDLKHDARRLLVRLAGWADWDSMIASGCIAASGVDRQSSKGHTTGSLCIHNAHRHIMIHEFGVIPAYANHFLWLNPVGQNQLFAFDHAAKQPLYAPGQRPSLQLPNIIAALDTDNRGRISDTDESQARGFKFTHPEVYASLLDFLGWDFTVQEHDAEIPPLIPLTRLGFLKDAELGSVEVFTTGLSVEPYALYDQPFEFVNHWALERQVNSTTPVVVLYSEPCVMERHGNCFSCFGFISEGGRTWPLILTKKMKTIADAACEIIGHQQVLGASLSDDGYELALRFSLTKRRSEMGASTPAGVRILAGPSGWGEIHLSSP